MDETTTIAKMNPTIKAKWLEKLRSGKYSQARFYLNNQQIGGYCCLGVLCEVAVEEGAALKNAGSGAHAVYADATSGFPSVSTLGPGIGEWAGLSFGSMEIAALMKMNDTDGWTFTEIADWAEEYL